MRPIQTGDTIAVKTYTELYTCTAVDGDQITLDNGETLRAVYCTPIEPYQDAYPVGTRVLMQDSDTVGTIEGPITAPHGVPVAPIRWDSCSHIAIDWDVKGLRYANASDLETR